MPRLKITVATEAEIVATENGDEIADRLLKILPHSADFEDGRYCFAHELIVHGLQLLLDSCLGSAVHDHFLQIHGAEMVELTPETRTARFVLEADKWLKSSLQFKYVSPDLSVYGAVDMPEEL